MHAKRASGKAQATSGPTPNTCTARRRKCTQYPRVASTPSAHAQRPILLWRWLFVILWMGVIFFFSSQPQAVLNLGQPAFVGKLAHVTEYAILGWLIQRAFDHRGKWWKSWLIAVAYAVTDEFHQSFVPGRTALATDVLIDSAGTVIGLAIAIARR